MDIKKYVLKIKSLGACQEAIEDAGNFKTSQEVWDAYKRGDWMLWLIEKLIGKVGDEPSPSEGLDERRKRLVLTTCKCARLSLHFVKEGEKRPLKAIETAEQWASGKNGVTLEDVRNASNAAYAASTAAARAAQASASAASAAAYAASAAAAHAHAAAFAAAYAAHAASAAADAAYYAAFAAYSTASAHAHAFAAAYAAYAAYSTASAHAAASAVVYAVSAAAYAASASGAKAKILIQCADIVRAAYHNVDELWDNDSK